jgi:DNA-binding CsgD family transcriptional regulator
MGSYRPLTAQSGAKNSAYTALFASLTAKQHEVYALVAEGRSSKEIAWKLGITDSAVNQRIEAVRSRAGSPARAELARAYRHFVAEQKSPAPEEAQYAPDTAPAVASEHVMVPPSSHLAVHGPSSALALAGDRQDHPTFIVPHTLLGANAGLNRMVAMAIIAVCLTMVALVGFSVLHALTAML